MNAAVRGHLLAQAGVLSRDQALKAGVSPRQIDRLLGSGDWLAVRRGIYRLHAAMPLPETGLWAAALWLGQSALLADEGAAWWWGDVTEPPDRWTFVTPVHREAGPEVDLVDGFVDPRDRTRHRGIAVMARPWSILRTAGHLERRRSGEGIALIDRTKQKHAVTHDELARALERHAGGRGSIRMRMLLRRTGDDAHSELERLAISILRSAGITGFVVNHRTTLPGGRRVEIDLAFVERRVAIELDGYAYHSSPSAFRSDLQRANLLMGAGWTVRRFTYSDLLTDPDGFIRTVRELLA